jgi:ABC-2 type transport system permease protein
MAKAWSFIRRDFRVNVSYRLAFLLRFLGLFFSVALYYFIAELIGGAAIPQLESYGGDYFAFLLIGIALSGYLGTSLGSFSGVIRREQVTGTLEMMLLTPTRLSTIIISSSLWSFLLTSINVFLYLLLGVLLFGLDLGRGNWPAALLVLALTILCFSSLGVIAAAFIMVLKRGDPVTWAFGMLSNLLGGVYYPVTIMPQSLQYLSYLLPVTYSLRAMRHALLMGYSFVELLPDIAVLSLFCLVLLPLSLISFRYAVHRAKVEGSLTHY